MVSSERFCGEQFFCTFRMLAAPRTRLTAYRSLELSS